MSHQEVPIKVTAWVDEEIAPLVSALNEIEGVVTLDSCQGDAEHPASVFFSHRSDTRATADFAANLAATLEPVDDMTDFTLTAEWRAGTDEPLFRLVCPAAHIDKLTCALSSA